MKKRAIYISIILAELILLVVCFLRGQNAISERAAVVEDNQKILAEKTAEIAEKNAAISELEGVVAAYEDANQKDSVVRKYGQLSVKNGKVVDKDGNIFQLKGMSTHGLTWYPMYINAGSIKSIKDMGANVIRLAMYTEQNGSYSEDPKTNRTLLYMGIENAIANDIYVIADWHVLRDENPLRYMDEAKVFFEELSAHYGDCPNIIYEICNEPNHGTSWEDISQYADEIIPIIRKNAKDAVIIVGTPDYDKDLKAAMEDPLEYDNILYSYHKYIYMTGKKHLNLDMLKEAVDSDFPVFVSEWGISHEGEYDYDEADTFLGYLKDESIGWCVWSLSNKDEAYSIILPECDKYSEWTDDDLTEIGKYYKTWLEK